MTPLRVGQAPVMRGHMDTITALALLTDGRIASGGLDSQLCLWVPNTGVCEVAAPAGGKITGLAALSEVCPGSLEYCNAFLRYHPFAHTNSSQLAAAARAALCVGLLAVRCVPLTGMLRSAFVMSGGAGCPGYFLQARVATAHLDCVRLWACTESQCALLLTINSGKTNRIVALPDGRLVTAHDGKVNVWSAQDGTQASSTARPGAARTLGV